MTLSSTEAYTRDHRTAVTKAWAQPTERISSGEALSVPDPLRKVPQQAFHAPQDERKVIQKAPAPRRLIPDPDLRSQPEEGDTPNVLEEEQEGGPMPL